MTRGVRIVVLGMVGDSPFAGVAWQALHYLEALRRLGHDVHYIEDTGRWPFDLDRNALTANPRYTVEYLGRVMAWAALGDRWAYRAVTPGRPVYGRSAREIAEVLATADVLLNLTGATVLGEEHRAVPVRIYLETDPVLPQIEVALGNRRWIELLAAHTHHFTFGERLGAADCGVPVGPFAYQPTRQPVVLEWWATAAPQDVDPSLLFTTVGNWRQREKAVRWRGTPLSWSKHERFAYVLDLPRRSRHRFELALARADAVALARLVNHGWRVLDAVALTKDLGPYRDYIQASHAEFTVAKEQNVRLRSGWFSDRSACYLAAGKPVVTEDTGFEAELPTGRGLFAFRTLDDAAAAVDAVATDYAGHARAAREIADAYLKAERVVGALLARAGV
jgi:hypothetical protein